MKYLKIENNKGYYRIDETSNTWTELDQINKEHLLKLLTIATESEFDMDEYDDNLLQNPAHNIIYKNLYRKFEELLTNKTRFQDSVETMYKAAIDKYKLQTEAE